MFTVKETTLNNPISFANSVGTLIVSDNAYKQIKSGSSPKKRILSINGKTIKNNEQLFNKMNNLLGNGSYLQGHTHRINDLISANSSTFLLIGFLLVLFFIATGSIIYFNNISAISDSKADYKILSRMGYSDRKIKEIIRKQIAISFSIPLSFGLIDCLFATIVYKIGLMQNLLGNAITLYVPTLVATVLTSLIYLVYYYVTVRACYKKIFEQ